MISDQEARRIAYEWHGGGGSPLHQFASRGEIKQAMINEATKCLSSSIQSQEDLEAIIQYFIHHDKRGPVPGWSDMPW